MNSPPNAKPMAVIGNAFKTIMRTLPLLTLAFLFGCSSLDGHIEQQVDSKVEIAKKEMNAEVQKAKEEFTALYQKVEESNINTLDKYKLQELNFAITATDSYLDSLKEEIGTLDEMDVDNVELVKSTFLYNGAGDSIINKFKRSIAAAQNVAKTEHQKMTIKSSSDSLLTEPSADKWKEQTFGLTNPLGASMIICGLQTELYKIGMKAVGDR